MESTPPGGVRTYGWIAREIGAQAARAVGTARPTNPSACWCRVTKPSATTSSPYLWL
jgi:alkylated DNA nucleotide flippase Atl1